MDSGMRGHCEHLIGDPVRFVLQRIVTGADTSFFCKCFSLRHSSHSPVKDDVADPQRHLRCSSPVAIDAGRERARVQSLYAFAIEPPHNFIASVASSDLHRITRVTVGVVDRVVVSRQYAEENSEHWNPAEKI